MFDRLYMGLLDMTKTASIVIAVIMIGRVFLRKAPKIFSYALWSVVLWRLLCPVTLEAPVGIIPELPATSSGYTLADEPIDFAGAGMAAYQALGDALNGGLGVQHVATSEKTEDGMTRYVTTDWRSVWILFGKYIWIAGVVAMFVASAVSYGKVKRKIRIAVPLRENILIADDIQSPFVIGFIRPRIYLPSNLNEREQTYIIIHEQHHIHRFDHIIKVLAFLALTIHWFNPMVWIAFVLACKDMEMSCDEAVIRKVGGDVRADYAASLLTLATGRRIIAGTPLAFGEGDTKGRIKNLSKWKRPAIWILVAALLFCLILGVCLLTNRVSRHSDHIGVTFYYGNVTEQGADSIDVLCNDGIQRLFYYDAGNEDISGDLIGKQVKVRARIQELTGNLFTTQVVEISDARFDSLDKAIQNAILSHHSYEKSKDVLECASFFSYASDSRSAIGAHKDDLVTKYGIVYHQNYRLENGKLVEEGGCNVPTVLTFRVDDEGLYVLAEYWEPRDGNLYVEDIKAKYPAFVWPDETKNLFEQKVAIFNQVMEGFKVEPEVIIDHLITDICDRERWAGNFEDLMLMCKTQREILSYYADNTLRYCLTEFGYATPEGTRGKVMAYVCNEILDAMGHKTIEDLSSQQSGKAWFDSYLDAYPEKNWGISLKAESATPNGVKITMIQEGGYLPNRLIYGLNFNIQKYVNNQWVDVEPLQEQIWHTVAYAVPLNDSVSWDIDWSNMFGALEPGQYRFCKGITDCRAPGDNDYAMFYAEFEIY